LSDEDLLLRATMPAEQVDAMAKRRQASGGALNALLESLSDGKAPYSLSIRGTAGVVSVAGERSGGGAHG